MLSSCVQHGYPRDCPQQALDWVLASLASALFIPFGFANVVILLNKHRYYFRAQGGVDLILGCSLAGTIWITSSFVTNNHFDRNHVVLRNCTLWSFWLQLAFGFCPWLVCIMMRLQRMNILYTVASEQIYKLHSTEELSWRHSIWSILSLTPAIVLCIFASVLHAFDPSKGYCALKQGWKLGTFFSIPIFYFSAILIFLCRLRRKKDLLLTREYEDACESAFVAFVIYLLIGTTYMTHTHKRVAGRCFLTFCICCLVYLNFWRQAFWAVYLCVFRPEEMDKFEKETGGTIVRALALENIYAVRNNRQLSMRCSQEAMFQALATAPQMVEMVILEKEKLDLVNKIAKLKQQLALQGGSIV